MRAGASGCEWSDNGGFQSRGRGTAAQSFPGLERFAAADRRPEPTINHDLREELMKPFFKIAAAICSEPVSKKSESNRHRG